MEFWSSLYLFVIILFVSSTVGLKVSITGPGLYPGNVSLPARYMIVNFSTINVAEGYSKQFAESVSFEIIGQSTHDKNCRIWVNKLDRKDSSFIVRYKLYETCYNLYLNVFYKNNHVEGSPFKLSGVAYPDDCICPEDNFDQWLQKYGCPNSINWIQEDINKFHNINMSETIPKIVKRFHQPESKSFCHYVLKNNELFRQCYGKHVGFNMFSDKILLFLTRKVVMPDMELVINLGDWPFVAKNSDPLPIFSWCGSDDTIDMILPTYDITESTLENMGRVSMDMLSVQGSTTYTWPERESKAFWRGRDSRAERLKVVDIARQYPDLINASLTNFFFFRDKEEEYGPKQPHISFFKFFDYKYQVNIDGTVAAYRLPYLLAGGGLVLKQDSPYHEHFYRRLKPWVHYVPVSRDLSDLTERIRWAKDHDKEAQMIAENGKNFANEHLLPQHIICYHAVLFKEWSKKLINEINVLEGMEHVPHPEGPSCGCEKKGSRDEL